MHNAATANNYKAFFRERTQVVTRVAILTGSATLMVLALMATLFSLPAPDWFLGAVLMVTLLMLLTVYGLAGRFGAWHQSAYIALALLCAGLVAAACVRNYLVLGELALLEIHLLIFVYIYFLSPLSVPRALIVALLVAAIILLPLLWAGAAPRDVVVIVMTIGSFNLVGIAARILIDRQLQREFGLRQSNELLANHDSLTGLVNRRAFYRHMESWCRNDDNAEKKFLLAILDLDHFKVINDEQGHDAGDWVLKKVAGYLQEAEAYKGDMCCRLGGDEFLVFLTEENAAADAKIRLSAAIGQVQTFLKTLGCGAAEPGITHAQHYYSGNDPRPLGVMVEEVDKSLYKQKALKKAPVEAPLTLVS